MIFTLKRRSISPAFVHVFVCAEPLSKSFKTDATEIFSGTVDGMFVWIYVAYPIIFSIQAAEEGREVAASGGGAGLSR